MSSVFSKTHTLSHKNKEIAKAKFQYAKPTKNVYERLTVLNEKYITLALVFTATLVLLTWVLNEKIQTTKQNHIDMNKDMIVLCKATNCRQGISKREIYEIYGNSETPLKSYILKGKK